MRGEKMKYYKIIIAITFLVFLILLTLLCMVLLKKNENKEEQTHLEELYITEEGANFKSDDPVDISEYLTIKNCINDYIGANEIKEFIITDLSVLKRDDEENIYKAKGLVYTESINNIVNYDYYVIHVSQNDLSYAAEKIDEKEYNKILNIDINNDLNYQKYEYPKEDWETISGDYMNRYKKLMLIAPENIYNKMTEEYREKRFGNIEAFKEYAKNARENIQNIEFAKYQTQICEGYVEYICLDQYDNIFIFDEKNANDYSIIIDTHTIDVPQFLEKYKNGNNQTKIALNINKVFEAINDKDYKYVYNKLNDTYKRNNFPTMDYLVDYIENNLYNNNKVEFIHFEKKGDNIYTYELNVKDKNDENSEERKITIIMSLLEDTEFVMSFGM